MVVPLFMGAPLASWGTSSAVVKLAPGAPGLEYFAAAAASFFLDAQKEAKEAPGGATGRTSALRPRSPCCLPPGPPFYGGRQLGGMAGQRKGAGGVRIDFAPPTAAAAWVGFPVRWFLRLRARLWHGGAQVPRWGGAGGSLHHPGALAAPQEAREGNPALFQCPPHQGPVGWHLGCRAWGISPLAAATYFARCGKVGKAQPGTRPMDYGCAPLRLGP